VRAQLDAPDVEVPYALLVDADERPQGWLTKRDLAGDTVPATADAPLGPVLDTNDVMRDALADLLQGESMYAPVVDRRGHIVGILSIEIISEFLNSPVAATEERGAIDRPLGPDRASEIAADE
jgi:CBS-domain-containing membrane protein